MKEVISYLKDYIALLSSQNSPYPEAYTKYVEVKVAKIKAEIKRLENEIL